MELAAAWASKLHQLALEPTTQVSVAFWILTVAVAAATGSIAGAGLGLPFALLTLGLSVPLGAAFGGLFGFFACLCTICLLFGRVTTAGYGARYVAELRAKEKLILELRELVANGKYGKANRLAEVTCKRDLVARFSSTPGVATDVGPHFAQYLEDAVNLYRSLNDNKTGAAHLKTSGQPNDVTLCVPPDLAKFENIIGNFERKGDSSGWMFAKREARDSPIEQRELWLVVRGSTTLIDWRHDAAALLKPVDIGLGSTGICIGFYEKACSIMEDMEKQNAVDAVGKLVGGSQNKPFDRIFIVGHSLAGAVVTQFQCFTSVPLSNKTVCITESAKAEFCKLQRIWAAALGGANILNKMTMDSVSGRFLTFALEPAPAFKCLRGPSCWEVDAFKLQTEDSFIKRVLGSTVVLTVYGGDPVPRLNIEIGGLALPPVKLGLFYSTSDEIVMPRKYMVNPDTFYLMDGPLADNRIVRFLPWSGTSVDTLAGRVAQVRNIVNALHSPNTALQLAAGQLGADHVAMFRPDTFVKGLQDLPTTR